MSGSEENTTSRSRDEGNEQQQTQARSAQSRGVYGNNITDIFNRPDTKPIIIQTAGLFSAVGIAYGFFGLLAANQITGGEETSGLIGGAIVVYMVALIASLIGPIISVITTIRADYTISYLDDKLRFATHASGSAIGQLGLMIVALLFTTNSTSTVGIGDLTNVIIVSIIATAITAVACVYVIQSTGNPVTPQNSN